MMVGCDNGRGEREGSVGGNMVEMEAMVIVETMTIETVVMKVVEMKEVKIVNE